MTKDNGVPAFPIKGPLMSIDEQGMTLRDYFAAQSLPAIFRDYWEDVRAGRYSSEHWQMGIAKSAYLMADAMLKAREE
jgi:hypothetical protein